MNDITNAEVFDKLLKDAIAMSGMDIRIKTGSSYIEIRRNGEWHNLTGMTPELFEVIKREILGLIARPEDYFDNACRRAYVSRNLGESGLVRIRLEGFPMVSGIEFFMSLMPFGNAIAPEFIDTDYSTEQRRKSGGTNDEAGIADAMPKSPR